MVEFQLFATRNGERHAKHTTGILKHEINLVGRYFFCSHNEVALVFTVFVINNNYEFTGFKVDKRLLYGI